MLSAVYLISSLPALSYGEKPPIGIEELMSDAAKQLPKKSFRKLELADIRNINHTKKNGKWSSFDELLENLENDKILIRNAKQQNQHPNTKVITKSVNEENPLEREKTIMKMQWDELSSIEFGESFSFNEIMIYKLKLQILHRLNSFQKEKGMAVFQSLVNSQNN